MVSTNVVQLPGPAGAAQHPIINNVISTSLTSSPLLSSPEVVSTSLFRSGGGFNRNMLSLFGSKVPRDFCLAVVVISPTHSTGRKSIGRSRPMLCLMLSPHDTYLSVCRPTIANLRTGTYINTCRSMSSVCPTLRKRSVCHSRAAHSHTHTLLTHTLRGRSVCFVRWTGICPPSSIQPAYALHVALPFIGDGGDAMPIIICRCTTSINVILH